MTPDLLAALRPEQLPELIPPFLAQYIPGSEAADIQPMLADWTLDDFATLHAHLLSLGHSHTVADSHARCRQLARDYMRLVFTDYAISGADFLQRSMDDGPTVILTNHLSYIDALATDSALAWSGHTDLADQIIYLAGPKVYADVFRLMAAASIHNLPVPQSTRLEHTEPIPPRELARRVRTTLDASKEALSTGRAVLLYPEGSRARDGRLGSFLQATRRYVSAAKYVVPAAVVGTDHAMPLDEQVLRPSRLTLSFAPPIPMEELSGREGLHKAHEAINRLLPEAMRSKPEQAPLC